MPYWLLNGPPPGRARPRPDHPPRRRPTYGRELVSVLKAIWRAAGYPWSVRLKALIPLWNVMPDPGLPLPQRNGA
ncbi:MAG TPA: hypothetical protein VMG63_02975 [Terriglobia bacterium]|nr:hypothetical protein [Terriglobia bacterium]